MVGMPLLILAWLAGAALALAIVAALLEFTGVGRRKTPPPGWGQPPADWVEEMRARREESRDQGTEGPGA